MKLVNDKFRFKSGGLHEKHIVATWNLWNPLSICLWTQGNQKKTCVEVAGRKYSCVLTVCLVHIVL